jgi:hypothetical protein
MKYLFLLAAMVFAINVFAQERPPGSVSTPQYIVVDSRDNVFVTLKYGMLKIAPKRHGYRSFQARSGHWRNGSNLDQSHH